MRLISRPAFACALVLTIPLALAACSKPAEPTVEASATPAATATPDAPPPPIEKPTEIGSQPARDDLYCAGLIVAANPMPEEAAIPVDQGRIMAAQGLAMALSLEGTGKLIDEGVALAPQTGAVADAWADLAANDLKANKTKQSLDVCMARAQAVVDAAAKADAEDSAK